MPGSLISFWRLTQPSRRDEHVVVLGDDELLGRELGLRRRSGDERAALARPCRSAPATRLELARARCPSGPSSSASASSVLISFARLRLLLELLLDDEDLEAREAVELELEDGVGLLGVELEPRHDRLRRVGLAVRLADDLDDLRRACRRRSRSPRGCGCAARGRRARAASACVTTSRRKCRKCQRIAGDRAARAGRPPGSRSGRGRSG